MSIFVRNRPRDNRFKKQVCGIIISIKKSYYMQNIVEVIKEKLLDYSKKSFEKDGYDFWNNHIKYVFKHSHDMAITRGADVEVCELAALFHDMAMVADFGPRDEHEKYGAQMARSMLTELNYPKDKIDLIEQCVLNHRSSGGKLRESTEEQIVADADVIAHLDSIPSLFSLVYNKMHMSLEDGREYIKNKLLRDYQKLSPEGQKELQERFDTTMNVLFVE